MGTEGTQRFEQKLRSYEQWFRSKRWQFEVDAGHGFPPVLLFTNSNARMVALIQQINQYLASANLAEAMPWYITAPDVIAKRLLLGQAFHVATREMGRKWVAPLLEAIGGGPTQSRQGGPHAGART
jgi:hypothetical protein